MTQIATCSSLVVATVSTWLMVCKYLHFTVREGRLICETKIPMQELELKMKMQGGLCARGV